MDETRRPATAEILLFRRAAQAPSRAGNPIGHMPVQRRRRFVYDIDGRDGDFSVSFDGVAITRHKTFEAAVANGRLIASNMWSQGIPTLVRVRNPDGVFSPLVSFG